MLREQSLNFYDISPVLIKHELPQQQLLWQRIPRVCDVANPALTIIQSSTIDAYTVQYSLYKIRSLCSADLNALQAMAQFCVSDEQLVFFAFNAELVDERDLFHLFGLINSLIN